MPAAHEETVTLAQARGLIRALAPEQSVMLLSPPGLGKSDVVAQTAAESGLECRSLLGTQIAPEDVSGIPRIVRERSVFCPPRVLLPEKPVPFCLFLDELPACSPDVQKAFYSLLLDRRIGEFPLPKGSWVVAAGNRAQDRALVRAMSSALVNRVLLLHVRADVREWLAWAERSRVRADIRGFISLFPDALLREPPAEAVPFSTPRAWASLSRALDLAFAAGVTEQNTMRALAFGRVSAQDASIFCSLAEGKIAGILPPMEYVQDPSKLPKDRTLLWFVVNRLRHLLSSGGLDNVDSAMLNRFLRAVPLDTRFSIIIDLAERWAHLGVEDVLIDSIREAIRA